MQRRIGDSNQRTAAVELLDLREALAANGYTPRPRSQRQQVQLKEKEAVRPGRAVRPVRLTRQRLSVGQQLTKMAHDFQAWTQLQTTTIEPPRQEVRQRRGISIRFA